MWTYKEKIDKDNPAQDTRREILCNIINQYILEDYKTEFGDTLQDLVKEDNPVKEPIGPHRKTTDNKPVKFIKARQVDINMLDKAKAYTDKLLQKGIISVGKTPTESGARACYI